MGVRCMKNVLAFDFGASNSRAVLGTLKIENGIKLIDIKEIHRFESSSTKIGAHVYWDFPYLFSEVKNGLVKANQYGFESVGIDTWGVDFGLIGKDGELLQNPVHYRDIRTKAVFKETLESIGEEELYTKTGCQTMAINTVFQLASLKKDKPWLLDVSDRMLLMPDLFNYFLTGNMVAERTIASTSQMYDPFSGDWDYETIEKIGLSSDLFSKIVDTGECLGDILPQITEELGINNAKVIAVASHDTASAIAATPTQDESFIFISSGTWSLFGTEIDKPKTDKTSREYNIANEIGAENKVIYLKNITGLWLIQETRRQFLREGKNYSYADMEELAKKEEAFQFFIDPNAPQFAISGNLPKKIKSFCKETGQQVPTTDGEVVRCIYESLAYEYKRTLDIISHATDNKYETIQLLGGGTKDGFLCDMAASSTDCTVKAGPIEATALGNILMQYISLGEVKDIAEAREIIANSFPVKVYEPQNTELWEKNYSKYLDIINK